MFLAIAFASVIACLTGFGALASAAGNYREALVTFTVAFIPPMVLLFAKLNGSTDNVGVQTAQLIPMSLGLTATCLFPWMSFWKLEVRWFATLGALTYSAMNVVIALEVGAIDTLGHYSSPVHDIAGITVLVAPIVAIVSLVCILARYNHTDERARPMRKNPSATNHPEYN